MDLVKHLEAFGFAVDQGVISAEECERMANALDEIESAQRAAGKTSNMTDSQVTILNVHLVQPDIFLNKIDIPKVMDTVSAVLQDHFILSNFNASRSGPKGGNRPHIDSRVPIRDFPSTIQVVAMLCLDDFTAENGATIVWPLSHKSGIDPRHIRNVIDMPGKIPCVAPRGSVVYTLGQTWHDIGSNIDGSRRWGIIAYYARWWVKPTYDFANCGSHIYSMLTPRQKALFGFNSRPPSDSEKRTNTLTRVEELPDSYEEALKL